MMLGLVSPSLHYSAFLPPNAVGPSFPHLRLASSLQNRHCFRLYASTPRPRPRPRPRQGPRRGQDAELSSSDYEDEDEDEDVDEVEDEDEDGGSDLGLALGEMNRWFADKPKGFGEGKVYDTGVEEKLLQEIEQSRAAQQANLAKLRSPAPSAPGPGKPKNDVKPIIDVPSGIPVRISNLPKKRNIHRDLKLAFEGFSGIVSISPVVSASKKTRDPICKGFGFVYLHSAEAAHRFVEVFSSKSIRFGKVEKRIICEAKDRRTPDNIECTDCDLGDVKEGLEDFDIEELDSCLPRENDGSVLVTTNPSDDDILLNCELTEDDNETIVILGSEEEKTLDIMNGATALSVGKWPTLQKVLNKQKPKKTRQKSSKLFVPRSAMRLKIKEKAVLTGVLSKYSGKTDEAGPLNAEQT